MSALTQVERRSVDGGDGDANGSEERRKVLRRCVWVGDCESHVHGADEDAVAVERDGTGWRGIVGQIALW